LHLAVATLTRPVLLALLGLPILAASAAGQTVLFGVDDIDDNGIPDLRITSNGGSQRIEIRQHPGFMELVVDANGDGDTLDANDFPSTFVLGDVDQIVVSLGGGNDSFVYRLAEDVDSVVHAFRIDLGSGNDEFSFLADAHTLGPASALSFEVAGGSGNDRLTFKPHTIDGAALDLRADLGAGNDFVDLLPTGSWKGGARVDLNVLLGAGTNEATAKLVAGVVATADVPGGSRGRIVLEGGPQKDHITVLTQSRVSDFGTSELELRGGAGNDFLEVQIDDLLFDVENPDGDESAGHARIALSGGPGNDELRVRRAKALPIVKLEGLLDLDLDGGAGNDLVEVLLGGSPLFFATNDQAPERGLAVRAEGGPGKDTLRLDLFADDATVGPYDVSMSGGADDDVVDLTYTVESGDPSFGFAGAVLLDGGTGTKDGVAVHDNGSIPVRTSNFELELP